MFDLSLGSIHGKDDVAGYIFACRPDDPGRTGIVTLGLWAGPDNRDHRGSKTALHTYDIGFRVTNMHDYQRLPLAWSLDQVKAHLTPTVRMHFEAQVVLMAQDSHWQLRVNGLDWR